MPTQFNTFTLETVHHKKALSKQFILKIKMKAHNVPSYTWVSYY